MQSVDTACTITLLPRAQGPTHPLLAEVLPQGVLHHTGGGRGGDRHLGREWLAGLTHCTQISLAQEMMQLKLWNQNIQMK